MTHGQPVIKAVYADMDGTLVSYAQGSFHSSWDAVGHSLCERSEWDEGFQRYYGHPEKYEEWIQYNANLLCGKSVEAARQALLNNGSPPYNRGVRRFYRAVTSRVITGIVTSGLGLLARHVQAQLGMNFAVANELLTADGRFTGLAQTHVPLWQKADVVRRRAEQDGVMLECTCFIGDNENDIPVLKLVGLPVIFKPYAGRSALVKSMAAETGRPDVLVIDSFMELRHYV
ncbi:haloacid dehalogenase-like hydrolase [bacterium]|nr:haloacid dehalogenase-like hydrolase [candidate division CSSED10-310 bacterium]